MFKFLKIGCLGFIGLVVLVAIFGSGSGDNNSPTGSTSTTTTQQQQAPKNYTEVDVAVMMSDLENNAMAAQKKAQSIVMEITFRFNLMTNLQFAEYIAPSTRRIKRRKIS